MGHREPSPEELEASRDARVAAQQLNRLEIANHHLEEARRIRDDLNQVQSDDLNHLIVNSQAECLRLKEQASGRIESRRRPRKGSPTTACTVFLDECGQHQVDASDQFPVFVLAAVIIRDADYPEIDRMWKEWKVENIGADVNVHEPDIRRRDRPFSREKGRLAIEDLPRILGELDFATLAVVIHRSDYFAEWGTGPIDSSLPAHAYMVALDFLMERTVLALTNQMGNARATLVAESRGSKEDASLQYEFARLHLDGTSYIKESWFRQQLHPGINFMSKADNNTGLQLADLLARPIGEKVIDPANTPDRWPVFRDKLCPDIETKNSILGLKIIPWKEAYIDLWKS